MRYRITLAVSLFGLIMTSFAPALRAGWTLNGAPVCTWGGDQEEPEILPDGSGGAFIVWNDNRTWTDIYAQRLDEMGRRQWAEGGVIVVHEYLSQARVKIAPDGAGGFIAVWTDSREESHWDIYAQRVGPDGSILWNAAGVPVCTAVDDQDRPVICSDGAGGCIVAWFDERVAFDQDDVYAQRIDPDGNMLWAADGVAVCTADSVQEEVHIVSDGSGGAIITWTDYRDDTDIYAQRLDPGGVAQWGADGTAVIALPGVGHYDHDMDTDGAGGIYVTWEDRQIANFDIRIQRVIASGSTAFAANGLLVCGALETQRYPVVAYDGEGGAVVTWEDFRENGQNSDVYAQRVASNGTLLWSTPDGLLVCDNSANVFDPMVMSDSDGGAIIVWEDNRDALESNRDIYAQRVSGGGLCLWTANGDSICRAVNTQWKMAMASDGAGGAIIAWEDERDGDANIYAQKITAAGGFVSTVLASFGCSYAGEGVLLEWRVSEPRRASDFIMARKARGAQDFIDISGVPVTADGMEFGFLDVSAEPGVDYSYRVDIAEEGRRVRLFETGPVPVPAAPLALYQNVPNPFNPSTTISWYLDGRSHVTLDVFDASGRKVARLVDRIQETGDHDITWSGTSDGGTRVASGIYLYRLTAGKRVLTKKMVLLR